MFPRILSEDLQGQHKNQKLIDLDIIMKIYQMKYFVLFLLIVFPAFSKLYQMIHHCQKDFDCQSKYRIILCGEDGFQIDRCADQDQCSSDEVTPFQATVCSSNFDGRQCQSGVCYYWRQQLSCTSYGSQCPIGNSVAITCSSCSECPSGICLNFNGVRQCSSNSECHFSKISGETIKCNSHDLGKFLPCMCCIVIKIDDLTPKKNEGLCTDDSTRFKQIEENFTLIDGPVTDTCQQYVGYMSEAAVYKSFILLAILMMII